MDYIVSKNFESLIISIIMLSICTGILAICIIIFIGFYNIIKNKLYLSITILGLLGLFYIINEIGVIAFSVVNIKIIGSMSHRLQALSTTCFIFALPYYLYYLLNYNLVLKKINRILYICGLLITCIIIIASLILPDKFLTFEMLPGRINNLWNLSRGNPKLFYYVRDILLLTIGSYGIIVLAIFSFISKNHRHLCYTFLGTIVAIASGLIDLFFAFKERQFGLFSIRVFSFFSLGITFFILLSMISILKWFIDQTKYINRTKRIESLGVLAGGIAHDFNNFLTGILGNASLAMMSIDKDKNNELFGYIKDIEKAATRAKGLTKQLLTFSKGGAPLIKISSVVDLIIDTVNFILSGSEIKCKFDFNKNLWKAKIDQDQISQVIQNIVLNAKEAMQNRGYIEIKVDNVSANINDNLKTKNYLKIDIIDNGNGIPEEIINSIFDPYFTTKETGSGLGLSICYSIIKQHGGEITVKSKIGQGSVFSIYLPAITDINDV
jgi:signal transduction histidine kinase